LRFPVAARLRPVAICAALSACGNSDFQNPDWHPRHIIYLHGQIVEDQGVPAFSERYGEYRFDDIVSAFTDAGFEVRAEVRDADADPAEHANETADYIMEILDRGVPPHNITVIGASKGAYIASLVSNRMVGPEVRYVLLAGCSAGVSDAFLADDMQFHGHVLAIRDASDTRLAGTCRTIADQSPALLSFEEVVTDTGLEHGLIFAPHREWVLPAIEWAEGSN